MENIRPINILLEKGTKEELEVQIRLREESRDLSGLFGWGLSMNIEIQKIKQRLDQLK